MEGDHLSYDIRPLVRSIGKLPRYWLREDLVGVCLGEGIRVINLRYPALDGKLKQLRVPVTSRAYLERILTVGERVDGSSLFPGLFAPDDSDLYVVPVYRWAFLNPWAADELDIVCRFADRGGKPCASTPDNILVSAAEKLRGSLGVDLHALAELEFYLFTGRGDNRFTSKVQRNYHQSIPYLHGYPVVDEILRVVSTVSGCVKYCHSEVGYLDEIESDDSEINGRRAEQYELEFDLMPIEDLGCWITVARWLIRVIADRHGASATFLPKLDEGVAGSGMHVHLALERDARNLMVDEKGELSDDALDLIGGLLRHAGPLTAFGNTVSASYLRLVPGQEAPTRICWGRHNRSSLIRMPLNFVTADRLDRAMNPGEEGSYLDEPARPTVEYRSPDGSAYPHLLLAAITACVEDGLSGQRGRDEARRLEVGPEEASGAPDRFVHLPTTAVAAAATLDNARAFFEARGFPPRLIDIVVSKLRLEADEGLSAKLRALPAAERLVTSRRLMHKDLHKH